MHKKVWIALGALLGLTQAPAQNTPPQLPTHSSNNTLLWQVSGNGLSQPSYFLGTMHILCPEDAVLSPQVEAILDYVSAVYLEIDMDNMAQMMSAMLAMNMKDNKTLGDFLTEEELQKVKQYFEGKLPLPFAMMQRYKPLMLQALIAQQMMPCNAGSGTETLLMAAAKQRNKSIEGLETMAFQAGLFDSIPYEEQAKALLKAIEEEDGQQEMADAMINSYKTQDLDKIAELINSEGGGVAGYMELLVNKRNRNWVEQFDALARQKSFLFAVGAGHLPGKEGVLELLRQNGYTVTPIENKAVPNNSATM